MQHSFSSWVAIPPDSDFTLANLPYGLFSSEGRDRHVGVAIGGQILDLWAVHELGFFAGIDLIKTAFAQNLNSFIGHGPQDWQAVRQRLTELLHADFPEKDRLLPALVPQASA